MTLARLLVAALLFCSAACLAQESANSKLSGSWQSFCFDLSDAKASTASEPWRIFPISRPARLWAESLDQIRLRHSDFRPVRGFSDVRNFD